MKKGMVCMVLLLWVPILGILLGAGCAGPKRQAKDEPAKMERLHEKKAEQIAATAVERTEKEVVGQGGETRVVPSPSGDAKNGKEDREGNLKPPLYVQGSPVPAARNGKALQKPSGAEAGAVQPAANAAKKGGEAPEGEGQKIVFNFDDADLYEVIRTLGDLLQIR